MTSSTLTAALYAAFGKENTDLAPVRHSIHHFRSSYSVLQRSSPAARTVAFSSCCFHPIPGSWAAGRAAASGAAGRIADVLHDTAPALTSGQTGEIGAPHKQNRRRSPDAAREHRQRDRSNRAACTSRVRGIIESTAQKRAIWDSFDAWYGYWLGLAEEQLNRQIIAI